MDKFIVWLERFGYWWMCVVSLVIFPMIEPEIPLATIQCFKEIKGYKFLSLSYLNEWYDTHQTYQEVFIKSIEDEERQHQQRLNEIRQIKIKKEKR